MADDRPRTSSIRSALAIRSAVDALLAEGGCDDPIAAVETVMREAKALEPRMIDETVAHLQDAYPPVPEPSFHGDTV